MTYGEPDSVLSPLHSTALSPLRYSVFRGISSASILSNRGTIIQSVGPAWWMIAIAPSADMVALLLASVSLPITLLSLEQ